MVSGIVQKDGDVDLPKNDMSSAKSLGSGSVVIYPRT